MIERYLISLENEFALALKFNLKTGAVVLGGPNKFRDEMKAMLGEYFRGTEYKGPTILSGRKIRYAFKMKVRDFDDALDRLKENGLVQKVRNHGRIMR